MDSYEAMQLNVQYIWVQLSSVGSLSVLICPATKKCGQWNLASRKKHQRK